MQVGCEGAAVGSSSQQTAGCSYGCNRLVCVHCNI